jgi:hypothetical protein
MGLLIETLDFRLTGLFLHSGYNVVPRFLPADGIVAGEEGKGVRRFGNGNAHGNILSISR